MQAYLAPAISALGVIVAIFLGWRSIRESALRREDVLQWANEAISTLETLLLVCIYGEGRIDRATADGKLTQILFDTSILIERGRMFFRNVQKGNFGRHKERAYRGFRPLILDPLVAAHQIAAAWPDATDDDRRRMQLLAEDCLKMFVSLAQQEVGRSKTVSADTRQGGNPAILSHLLQCVDPKRLAQLEKRAAEAGKPPQG